MIVHLDKNQNLASLSFTVERDATILKIIKTMS